MPHCPNKSSQDWKNLEAAVGTSTAFYLWDKFKGNVPKEVLSANTVTEETTAAQKAAAEKLNTVMREILSQINVSYKAVDKILDREGKEVSAVGKADMLLKLVEVVEGKAGIDTLPEEVGHFLINMLDPNGHIFKSMYDKITSYPIFDQVYHDYYDLYNGSMDMLKKEAMTKLLTQEILNLTESTSTMTDAKRDYANKWWNMLFAKLKEMFKMFDKNRLSKAVEDYSVYKSLAEKILNKDLSDFNSPITDTGIYYETKPNETQKKILDSIVKNSKNITINENTHKYYKNGELLGDSVTTIRDRKFDKKFKNSTPTQEQIDKKEFAGKVGNLVHAALDNLSKRILAEDDTVAKVMHVDAASYALLEKYVKDLKAYYDKNHKGTVFLAEQVVYDEKTNRPGTIDLVAIRPDGTVDIYDWKTMSINKTEKEEYGGPSKYKVEKYEWQLNEYRRILKNLGVSKFQNIRFIPIETKIKIDKTTRKLSFAGIAIGNQDSSKNADKPYLNPVPVSEERTGVAEIDKLLDQLKALHKDISSKKGISDLEKTKKTARIKTLTTAIRDLQLNKSMTGFINNGYTELKTIEAIVNDKNSTISEQDLVHMLETLKIYEAPTQKLARLYRDEIIPEKDQAKLDALGRKASILKTILEDKSRIFLEKAALSANTDISQETLDAQKGIGLVKRVFTSLSRIDHPVFKVLWDLISKSKEKVKKDVQAFDKEMQIKFDNLKNWAASRGISTSNMFDLMVDKKNGKLIPKYTDAYYKEKQKAIETNNYNWVKNNSVVNEEKLKTYIAQNEEFIKKHHFSSDEAYNKKIRETKLAELYALYDVFKHPETAYLNPRNYFIKPSESWHSEEYKTLSRPENAAAFEFYKFFSDKIKEFSEFLPVESNKINPDRFIPNMTKNFVEEVFEAGGSFSIKGLGEQFLDNFKYNFTEDPAFGKINEYSGTTERDVPVYFLNEIDANKKSYDLAKVLSAFSRMSYNYKHFSEIEATTRNLRNALEDSKEAAIDGSGKVMQNLLNSKVVSKVISADTLTLYDDFVNYYVYGIRTKDNYGSFTKKVEVIDPKTGEKRIEEVQYSKNKIASTALRYISAKALGGNLVSSFANLFGGSANVMMLAAGGNLFTKKQVLNSMKMISSGNFNPKALGLLEYFDMGAEHHDRNKANKMSVFSLSKHMNYDKLFILQESGDRLIQNVTLLSLLQNHGLDKNGKIVKLSKLGENAKSLVDLVEIKSDGTLNISNLISDEEFTKFRSKAQAASEKILGMSTRDNVAGYRMTLLGQAFMQFRGWIPRTLSTRFGETRFDNELGEFEKGRAISLVQQLWSKRFIPLAGELLTGFVSGKFGQNTKDVSRMLYLKYLEENPNVDPNVVTEDAFYDMHTSNLKAAMMEMTMIAVFTAIIFGLKELPGDEDKNLKRQRATLKKGLNRTMSELTFFYNPGSFQAIMQGALPAASTVKNIYDFGTNFSGELLGQITDNEERIKKNKPESYFWQLFPVSNEIWKWFGDKQENEK